MKLELIAIIAVCAITFPESKGQNIFSRAKNYVKEFVEGAQDMSRAYNDMKDANTIGADKYFHARGNFDAAQRGTGGSHAAAIISDAREFIQSAIGRGAGDSKADQVANTWGRNGEDPNVFRPKGLDPKY